MTGHKYTVQRLGGGLLSAAVVAWLLQSSPTSAASFDEDDLGEQRQRIIAGVQQIAAPGVPGPLVVTSDDAFVVVDAALSGGARAPVVAAGYYGDGRFVAFGHTGYVHSDVIDKFDTDRLMARAALWAANPSRLTGPPRIGATDEGMVRFFDDIEMQGTYLSGPNWIDKIDELDVVVCGQRDINERIAGRLRQFLQDGGGLLVGGLGWGWLQRNPGHEIVEHPCSLVLGPAGVFWAAGSTARAESFPVRRALEPELHAGVALDAIAEPGDSDDVALWRRRNRKPVDEKQREELIGRTLLRALQTVPQDDVTFWPGIAQLIAPHRRNVIPTSDKPVLPITVEGLTLAMELREARRASAQEMLAHPAADVFPGAVPADAPRVTEHLAIDTARPGWHSTGLYAPPGEIVELTVPEQAVGSRLRLRIGCHKDSLNRKPHWNRVPVITREFPVHDSTIARAWAFGGPIYIVVPQDCELGQIEVTISGGVAMPRYVLGQTGPEEWRLKRRLDPAPWAELETDKVIVTVPSYEIRDLDDPEPLMRFWDDVLDAAATLSAQPFDRDRPERYVADVQISAGYMHAGYPIMTHLDAASTMVDIEDLRDGAWGLYHELGHNHQHPDWTFNGTGEVTCNLFSLYINDQLCDLPPGDRGHGGASGDAGLSDYLAQGAPFEQWKRKPFLALYMYIQLQEAFGWDPFMRVFAEYRQLPHDQRPKTDQQKRDQWLVRMSNATGHDLGPFFQVWGVPTSAQARASVADLPSWMPDSLAAGREIRGLMFQLEHRAPVRGVTFSPDGTTVATSTLDGEVIVWDLDSREPVTSVSLGDIDALAYRADGVLLAARYDSNARVSVWDVFKEKELQTLPIFNPGDKDTRMHASSTPLAFSLDGTRLVATSGWGRSQQGQRIQVRRIWDTTTFAQVAMLDGLKGWIRSAALSVDGRSLVTGLDSGDVNLWEVSSGVSRQLAQRDGNEVRSVAFSPDATRVMATKTIRVEVWDVESGALITTLELDAMRRPFSMAAMSPDDRYLVAGFEDGAMTAWRTSDWTEAVTVQEHDGTVRAIAFSPDGKIMASASSDATVNLWSLTDQ
jgi:hypothetical protein